MPHDHDVRLMDSWSCGPDLRTLRFERPADYEFRAGQWFRLTLATAHGPLAETFSHCSAPADLYLEMTTRLSGSAFKQALARLMPGEDVRIQGPGGRLRLEDETTRIAFLAGGVGITPVRSMLRQAQATGRRFDDALLIYGNRDDSCVPFLDELDAMSSSGVRVVLVYERPPDGWNGESGFVTADTVRRHLVSRDPCPFIVSGPPAMVTAMEAVLDELGVSEDLRHVERFGVAR